MGKIIFASPAEAPAWSADELDHSVIPAIFERESIRHALDARQMTTGIVQGGLTPSLKRHQRIKGSNAQMIDHKPPRTART
jgi:hypothetical protein